MTSRAARSPMAAAITVIGLVFLVAPLLVIVLFSFQRTASLSLPFHGFSLKWYRAIFDDPEVRDALVYSLEVAVTVAAAMLVIGTLAAYGLSLLSPRTRGLIAVYFFLPLTLPLLFVGLSLRSFFVRIGVELSFITVAIGHLIYVLPYYLLIMRQSLERLDPHVAEAAATLGATPRQVFTRVVLPQIWPVMVAATALVIALSIDEFPITYWTAGQRTTLPIYLYNLITRVTNPSINAVSSLLVVLSLCLFALAFIIVIRQERRRSARLLEENG